MIDDEKLTIWVCNEYQLGSCVLLDSTAQRQLIKMIEWYELICPNDNDDIEMDWIEVFVMSALSAIQMLFVLRQVRPVFVVECI